MAAKNTSERIAAAFRAGTPVDRAVARAVKQATERSTQKASRPPVVRQKRNGK